MDELDKELRLIKADKEKTKFKKNQFIKEIRDGLGDHIKKSGNKIKKIKKPLFQRFVDKLMKMF
tara:strand:- start:152 stop:343 length:192 start_codon:yes stop_codon:yes gene_type:complete